jgi:hypothetical protein
LVNFRIWNYFGEMSRIITVSGLIQDIKIRDTGERQKDLASGLIAAAQLDQEAEGRNLRAGGEILPAFLIPSPGECGLQLRDLCFRGKGKRGLQAIVDPGQFGRSILG